MGGAGRLEVEREQERTSIRLPTHDSGDIILISARRTGSITALTFRISGIGAAQPPLLPRCATG
jgi:hypothetical protein